MRRLTGARDRFVILVQHEPMKIDFETKREEFKEYYANSFSQLESAARSFRQLIHLLLANLDGIEEPKIEARVKKRNECIEKFNLKYRKEIEEKKEDYHIKDYITDLIGVRVVCYYESEIDKVIDHLKASFHVNGITNKSAILTAKTDAFGYKGVHLDLGLNDERKQLDEYRKIKDFVFEVQVRSIVQDAWSVVDHKLKYKKSISQPLQRRVLNLAALFEMADREFDAIRLATAEEIRLGLEQSINPTADEPLNLFNFMAFVEPRFPDFNFLDFKVEGFIAELNSIESLSIKAFMEMCESNAALIEEYAKHRRDVFKDAMNPFTFIRHALYSTHPRKYVHVLFELQRMNFDAWKRQREGSTN